MQERRILEELLAVDEPRPSFEPTLAAELRSMLEEGLQPIVAHFTGRDSLMVSKHDLATVFSCEGRFAAELESAFEWSLATVRGRVAHRALERAILDRPANDGSEVTPVDRAEQALDYLSQDDRSEATFLANLDDDERHDLIRDVANLVTQFHSDWPTIKREWRPRLEFTLSTTLCDQKVTMRGKPDLGLGMPTGSTAKVMLVDFKSGVPRDAHRHDLRLYALIETLARKVPPFRVATYYLDEGEWTHEDVNEGLLEAAARRVIEGARRIEELRAKRRPPTLTPSGLCRWCPALVSCETGRQHLLRTSDDDDLTPPDDW